MNGISAIEALKKDAVASFEMVNMPKERMHFTDSVACIAEWLVAKKLVSLQAHFTKY